MTLAVAPARPTAIAEAEAPAAPSDDNSVIAGLEPVASTWADETAAPPSRVPALAMLAGGLVLVLAAVLLLTQIESGSGPSPAAATAAANPAIATPAADAGTVSPPQQPAASPITLSGPGDISLVRQVYEPGYDSGWHAHPGIHAVAVLSGTLTVYDKDCRVETYGPGQPYIGGQELHMARNETAAPLEMMVTYVSPTAPSTPTQHLPAPAGCTVGQA